MSEFRKLYTVMMERETETPLTPRDFSPDAHSENWKS